MVPIPTGVRVWLATDHTDMRKRFASLSLQEQEVVRRHALSGHLFCFRERRCDLLKVIWHDGQGACLLTKKCIAADRRSSARDQQAFTTLFSQTKRRLLPPVTQPI